VDRIDGEPVAKKAESVGLLFLFECPTTSEANKPIVVALTAHY